jgi:Icc-related predicted phosphoesterase
LDQVNATVHAGSTAVREFIERHRPEYFFCGHIHEAEGAEIQIGRTRARNLGKKAFLLELD